MKIVFFWLFLLFALPSLPTFAAAPVVDFMLTLRNADDSPRVNQQINIIAGDRNVTLTTNKSGDCYAYLPAAAATISIDEKSYQVILAAGADNSYLIVDGWRQVTQTLINEEGRPAAGAMMHASYAWLEQFRMMHAVADKAGIVHWPSVPPVPLVVWGDGVPVGVLAAAETKITAPLPLPQEDIRMSLNFYFPDVKQRINVDRSENGTSSLARYYDPDEFRIIKQGIKSQKHVGQIFSYLVLTKENPARIAWVAPFYLPIIEAKEESIALLFPLQLQQTATVHLRFVSHDNQPAVIPTRLEIIPERQPGLPELLYGDTAKKLGFFTPKFGDDGIVTVSLPQAGKMRLLIDCYDLTTTIPQELIVDVPAGESNAVVTLPPALLQIPPETELNWVTRNAPAVAQHFKVASGENKIPVYGPDADLLACWYLQDADHLFVWQEDGTTILQRRNVQLSSVDENGQPFRWSLRLAALLPRAAEYSGFSNITGKGSEVNDTRIASNKTTTTALWTAPYALTDDNGQMQTLTIPVGDEPQITLVAKMAKSTLKKAARICWNFPDIDYQALGLRSASLIKTIYDVPDDTRGFLKTYAGMKVQPGTEVNLLPNYTLLMPANATTVTFEWLGVGVIRDIAIPPASDTITEVILPDWDTGTTVTGCLYNSNGTPAANAFMNAYRGNTRVDATNFLQFSTDDEGKFTLHGIPPGALFIKGLAAGWTIIVPKTGLKNIKLSANLHPLEWRFDKMNGPLQAWWIPDTGSPEPVLTYDNRLSTFDRPASSGIFWIFNGNSSKLFRYVPGDDNSYTTGTSPSLGLYLPLDSKIGMPGYVQLTGLGNHAGMQVTGHIFWQPLPLLGGVLGQITAVPPGDYQVKVATPYGALTGTVTVADSGGSIHFALPPDDAGGAE